MACVIGLHFITSNEQKVTKPDKNKTEPINENIIYDPVGHFVVGDLHPLASDAIEPTLSNYL